MSEPVTCRWCGLTHDSPRSDVVHRGTRECVDSAACAARMAQKENDALLQERDEARAEVARLQKRLGDKAEVNSEKLSAAFTEGTLAAGDAMRNKLREVAERQREACAAMVEDADDGVPLQCLADAMRVTPLVTDGGGE